jgi:hypothetical protein
MQFGGFGGDGHGVVPTRSLPSGADLLGHVRQPAVALQSETPGGAWEFHRTLIPKSPVKPLRIWLHVADRDNVSQSDGMHDWVLANQNMARELAAKGYKYQFVFARNASHCDRAVKAQTLPNALEFVWKDYAVNKKLSK